MDTSKYIGFSDLTNQFEMNTDNITSNTINSTDINTTNINVSGSLNINGLVNNQFLFADLLGNVTSKNIVGTSNQINVDNSNNFILSLASDVSFNTIDISNNIHLASLPTNIFIGTDSSKNIVSKSISGTINQIQINNDVCGNYIISGYQDLNTTSAPAFSGITVNGSIIANTLSTNSLLATDGTKTVINRSLSGTANQVNINTAGTTTTFSTPQDIATTSNVVFNGVRAADISGTNVTISGATAGRILLSDINKKIITSSYGESDMVLTSTSQIIGGDKTFSGTTNLSGLTASKLVLTDTSKNIVSSTLGASDLVLTSTNQGIAGDKTYSGLAVFNNQISANGLFISGNAATFNNTATFNNPATFNNTATFGSTVNLPALTAGQSLQLDGAKNIVSVAAPSSLVGLNNTWTGTNTFGNTVNLSGSTASKLLVTDATKNVVSSAYSETDIAIQTNANTFTNVNNFTSASTVNIRGSCTIDNVGFNGTLNLSMLTAGNYLALDSSQNVVSVPVPTSLLGLNNVFTGINTFSNSIVATSLTTQKFVFADNLISPTFTVANGTTSIIQYANVSSSGITNTSNTTFTILVTGSYVINWTVRVAVAAINEQATWIEYSGDPSFLYGLTQIGVGCRYVSSSVTINCAVGTTLKVIIYNGRSDGATCTVVQLNHNQLSIKYISS